MLEGISKQRRLRDGRSFFRASAEFADDGLRLDRLLNVDGNSRNLERRSVLRVLASPYQLRVKRSVALVDESNRLAFCLDSKRLKFRGRDVDSLVPLVAEVANSLAARSHG